MVLGTIAGVASAAGSIASAFGGSGYSRKRHADQLKIESNQRRLDARAMPKMMREGADLAGYHPLAVLGMNPASGGSSVSFGGSGSNGSALEAMGQGISRAAESYMSKDERAMLKAGAALDLQNKELSNESQRLQNQRLASEMRLAQSGASPAMPSASALHSVHSGGRMPLPTADIESAGFIASLPLQADYLLRDLLPWYADEFDSYRRKARSKKRDRDATIDMILREHGPRWYRDTAR